MKKIFCDNCMANTECEYEESVIKEVIDGIEIEYLEKRYICSICHDITYDNECLDYNVFQANQKLREKTGLITVEEIKSISEKYNIGAKPLATVMGIGEATIMRYLDGKNPSKEISEMLKLALRSPEFFEINLMANKDKITELAFKKALGKVKQIELSNEHSKIYQTALYIASKYEDTTNLALQKILYFINGFSDNFLGSALFSDSPEAWLHGPVYPDIYDSLSYFKSDTIDVETILNGYEFELTEQEKDYIDNVASIFACYSGTCLRNMSDLTDPWLMAREGLSDDEYSNREIDDKDIKKYFAEVISKYNINSVEDISKYVNDLLATIIENNKCKKG